MDFKNLILLLAGGLLIVWFLIVLNQFVGGNNFLMYFGTPVMFGMGVIFFGLIITTQMKDYFGYPF